MAYVRLNIGSGNEKRDGFINIDKHPGCNPDIVRDVEKGLPFADNTVDEIYMKDVLEHIEDYVSLFNEMYRVCKNNTRIWIQVPHALCEAAHDVDHKSYWTERKFRQIADQFYDYYGLNAKFEIEELKIIDYNAEITFIHCIYKVIK